MEIAVRISASRTGPAFHRSPSMGATSGFARIAGNWKPSRVPSQFGHSFDDWGRHFLVSNSNHIRQEAIAARYLRRNTDLPVASAVEDISDHMPAAKVYPITESPRF